MAETGTNIGTLNVKISTNGISALSSSLRQMQSSANKTNLGKLSGEFKSVGNAAKSASKHTGGFGSSLIRIAKYRLLRSALKEIAQTIREGVGNLYEYSTALNSADAAANKSTMDQYASSLLYLKNAAGAAAGPLLQALLPVVKQLVDWFVIGANAVNQFVSALQGKSTFTRAVYTMTEFGDQTKKATGAAKELKKTIFGWDELNILQDNQKGSGSGGAATPNFSEMFEEAEIDSNIQKIADKLKPLIEYLRDNFSTILKIVAGIGAAMLVWKVASGVANLFSGISKAVGGKAASGSLSITNTLKGIANVALIVGGLTAIVVAYGELRKIPGFDEVVSSGTSGLAALFGGLMDSIVPMTAFSAGVVALGKIGVTTITKGLIGFAEIVAGLGVVILAIGELRKIDGFDDVAKSGGEGLVSLGYVIGDFVGSIIGGFSEGVTSGLPAIGKNLAGFMTNSKPFFDGISGFDSKTVKSALAVSNVIMTLTAASVLDGLTSWLTGGVDFSKFSKQLSTFGDGIVNFSKKVKGKIDAASVSAAAAAGKAIAELNANLPRSGGWAQKIAGEKDLDKFANALPGLGRKLKEFGDSVAGISGEDISAAASAGKLIADFQSNLPRTGGWAQTIAGEKDLTKFGNALPTLGTKLKQFSDRVKGLSAEDVTAAASAGKEIAELNKNLPATGGWAQKIAGEKDLDSFASKLPNLGTKIKSFSTNVKGINAEDVSAAANAAATISKIYQYLPSSGGLAELVAGKSDLSSFAKDMPTVGKYLKQFEQSVSGLDSSVVTNAANAATSVAKFAKIIPNDGGALGWLIGDNTLSGFSKQLPVFGTNFKKFVDNIGDVDTSNVTAATNAATSIAKFAKIIPNSGGVLSWFTGDNDLGDFGDSLGRFGPGFKKFVENIPSTGMENITKVANSIKTLAEAAKTLNESGGAGSAIKELADTLKKDGPTIASDFKTNFSFEAGKSVGGTWGSGFAQGVKKAIMQYTYPQFKITVSGGQNGTATGKVTAVDPNEEERLRYLYGYANGGFPDADIFAANENGVPELVGRIGNNTAVANQEQIIEGIKRGVFEAMIAANGDQNKGDMNISIQVGEYELANAVVSALNAQTRRIGYSQLEGI